jgi:Asp-tRNA(Asn)/Glu-tRNA(Gln) amidotransferase A subunit family amidase
MTAATSLIRPAQTPAESVAAIRSRDAAIHAWCHIDDAAEQQSGWPFGVKDMIDVQGMPTRAGSLSRRDAIPEAEDAIIVRRLRAAGGIPVGKTVTTEFAFIDPATTCNPHALAHSPGGSSSGSAAAVAAGMVPVALGTQTAGSLCRPAAYCGVAAIKPSYGLLPVDGMVPLSPSFDTPGVIARTVKQAARALAAMAENPDLDGGRIPARLRLACLADRYYESSSRDVTAFHRRTIATLKAADLSVEPVDIGINLDEVISDHRVIMLSEAFATHGPLLQRHENSFQPHFRSALASGASIAPDAVRMARARLAETREQTWNRLAGFDAIVLQPAPAPAPRGFKTTGDQSYQTPWTAWHGPMITVPGEFNDSGLPLATMIAAAPGQDATAIGIAIAIQEIIDRLPPAAG